jgi:hypothetical protein
LPYDGFPKPSLRWLNKPNGLYLEFVKREIATADRKTIRTTLDGFGKPSYEICLQLEA